MLHELTKENKVREILCLLICLLMLAPLVYIGRYDRPSADDYDYALITHTAAQEGGALDLIKAAWQTDVKFYNTWQGLYTSAFVLSLQPAIWGEAMYSLTPVIVLLFSFVCLFFGIDILNRYYLQRSKLFSLTAALFALTYCFLWLPSAVEGLYWYNGAMNYTPWAFATFLNLCILLKAYKTPQSASRRGLLILSAVLSFVISGANHVTAFANILLLLFAVIVILVRERRLFPLVPFLSACAGFLLMYAAPGTKIRAAVCERSTVPKTIVYTLARMCDLMGRWVSLVWLISLIILTPIAVASAKKSIRDDEKVRFPIVEILSSFVVLCGMQCVPLYAMSYFGAGRVSNVIWFAFTFLSWIDYFLIVRWVVGNKVISFRVHPRGAPLRPAKKAITPVLVLLLAAMTVITQECHYSITLTAAIELADGTAARYAEEMDDRIRQYTDEARQTVVVHPLENRSELLFFADVGSDPAVWPNTSISDYYGKTIYME